MLHGDVRAMLATLEPNSMQTCVTSPPYWGLRSYGTEPQVWGGDAEHAHEWGGERVVGGKLGHVSYGESRVRWQNPIRDGEATMAANAAVSQGAYCPCGAWLGELGNEPTPDLFVAHMVEVFRAVWRVLRPDGTLWLNLGFSYAGSGKGWGGGSISEQGAHAEKMGGSNGTVKAGGINSGLVPTGYKPKDLIPIPFLVAMALQQDGWYWRSIIAWAKKAPMPESVTDRPTSAWEPVLLMSKSRTYYYDADAVREESDPERTHWAPGKKFLEVNDLTGRTVRNDGLHGLAERMNAGTTSGRNMRNVWLLGPEPFPNAHFATFVTEIPRRCILAGTSEKGQCPQCGAPWERVRTPTPEYAEVLATANDHGDWYPRNTTQTGHADGLKHGNRNSVTAAYITTGWRPTCGHADLEPVPQTVLDPFAGAGTTLLVADRLNRHGIGIELKADYAEMARERIMGDAPLFVDLV